MNKLDNNKMPLFFWDDSEGDATKEAVIDSFLGWTMRCANIKYKEINSKVQRLAEEFVLMMIFGESEKRFVNDDNYIVNDVKIWKQWFSVDLVAEVELEKNGVKDHYVIIIENKAYSKLHDNQLARYMDTAEEFYSKSNFWGKFNTRYVYFTCHDEVPELDKQLCEAENVYNKRYKYWTLGSIQGYFGKYDDSVKVTGDTLFDEFWYRY